MGELSLADARSSICAFGRRMTADRLVVGTSGNISIRTRNMVVITPSGVDYADLVPESVSVVDASGRLVAGGPPSSELPLHLALYRAANDPGNDPGNDPANDTGSDGANGALAATRAVVHTHSPYATAAGLVADEIPPIHYLLGMFNGPVRVGAYARFGTELLAERTAEAIRDRFGALLANHGAVTIGHTLAAAYDRAVQLEWLCQVWLTARQVTSGPPTSTRSAIGESTARPRALRLLPDSELAEVIADLRRYGPAGRDH